MKTKVILFALVIALVAGLAVPALVSNPANAFGPKTTTTTTMGPIMIGFGKNFNSFSGLALSILFRGTLAPGATPQLANLSGLKLNGTFKLSFVWDPMPAPVTGLGGSFGGTLTSTGSLPSGSVSGGYEDMGVFLGNPKLSNNYIVFFSGGTTDGWGGLVVNNIGGVVTLVPKLLSAMGGPNISGLMPLIQLLVGFIQPLMPKLAILMPPATMGMLMPLFGG